MKCINGNYCFSSPMRRNAIMEAGLLFTDVFTLLRIGIGKKKCYKVLLLVVSNIKSEHSLNTVLTKRLSQWPNADRLSKGSRWVQQVGVPFPWKTGMGREQQQSNQIPLPIGEEQHRHLNYSSCFCQMNHAQIRIRAVYNLEDLKAVLSSYGWTSVF